MSARSEIEGLESALSETAGFIEHASAPAETTDMSATARLVDIVSVCSDSAEHTETVSTASRAARTSGALAHRGASGAAGLKKRQQQRVETMELRHNMLKS